MTAETTTPAPAPAPALATGSLRVAERRVPKFDLVGRLGERPEMNRLQRSFYMRDFQPGFMSGDPVDVNGQSGYATVSLHELADTIEADTSALSEIRRLADTYRDSGGLSFPRDVTAATYFLEGSFAAGYAAFPQTRRMNLHLALAEHLGYPPLTSIDVFFWSDRLPARSSNGRGQGILDRLDAALNAFHAEHGLSVLDELWRRLNVDASVEDVALSVEDDVIERFNGEQVRAILSASRPPEFTPRALSAFGGYPEIAREIHWPAAWGVNDPREFLVTAKCRQLLRDAENAQRRADGLPGVGEGWVSEMALLRELQRAFPDEKVVHQWRPWWLGHQSLDIGFPHRLVGVEYQGAQHSKPVGFFGGEEAFRRQQDRDRTKRRLCDDNGCALIEVHPGYVIDEVFDQVRAAFDRPATGDVT